MPSNEFGMEFRKAGNVVIVDLKGRIVYGEGSVVLRDKIRDLLRQGHKYILLNLSGVTYIDTKGLAEMISAYTTVTNNDGEIKLLIPAGEVRELAEIQRLYTFFDVYEKEDPAVDSFNQPKVSAK